MPINKLMLIGAGGHAKVVLDVLLDTSFSVIIIEEFQQPAADCLLGLPIIHLPSYTGTPSQFFHVAIGDNRVRQARHQYYCSENIQAMTVRHKDAVVSKFSTVGLGCFIAASAVVGPDARVADGTIINHNAVVDHDCVIGDFCHIAPQATLGGSVTVGHRSMIGANATILPGINIGDDVIVGAGAVVTKDVTCGSVVKGIPAQ